ncbi:DNA invertase Pin-like site-specific DNA recombinase [Elusimicrobium simillimum]|uniref:recombinase family protein n=1 Tax=Elusimicrobium simillimum TaxID=3143438 RepID=UPI003C6FBD1B
MYKNEKTSNKAVIYCRVSTEEQVKGESLDGQARQCRGFAERNSFLISKEFIEKGESGRTTNRTALKNLMGFCFDKRNDISAVICLKQDRMFRNVLDEHQLEKAFNKIGIRILYVNGNNDNNAAARLQRNIHSSFNQFESELNGERTKAGNTQAFLSGRYFRRLKGYDRKPNTMGKKQIYPNEDAKYIVKAFELMSKGVYKQREVLRMLQAEGFKSYPQAFNKLLNNPIYCGILPDRQGVNSGQSIKGTHIPLISEELFNKVQDILHGKRPNAIPRKRNNPLFPLRRYVRCLSCGEYMTASSATGKGNGRPKVPYYHCSKCRSSKQSRVLKKVLEPAFSEYLKSLEISADKINYFEKFVITAYKNQTADIQAVENAVKKEVNTLEDEMSRLIRLAAKGTVKEDYINREIEKIELKINEKKLLISEAEDGPNLEEGWAFVKEFVNNLAEIWDKADLDLRQRVQGLITPEGFYFEENLIKPQKNPCFISIFSSKTREFKTMGG